MLLCRYCAKCLLSTYSNIPLLCGYQAHVQSLCYCHMWCSITFLLLRQQTDLPKVLRWCMFMAIGEWGGHLRMAVAILWQWNFSYCNGITFCFLFFLLLSPLVSPFRTPDPGRFGGGERETGNKCNARAWQGRRDCHKSAPAAGEAVKARPNSLVLLWRIGDSVTSCYWLWVFFWVKFFTIIFLLICLLPILTSITCFTGPPAIFPSSMSKMSRKRSSGYEGYKDFRGGKEYLW